MAPRHEPGKTIDLSGNNAVPIMLARRAKLRTEITKRQAECEMIEAELKFKSPSRKRRIRARRLSSCANACKRARASLKPRLSTCGQSNSSAPS
jgi:hypothetical protein